MVLTINGKSSHIMRGYWYWVVVYSVVICFICALVTLLVSDLQALFSITDLLQDYLHNGKLCFGIPLVMILHGNKW